MWHWQHTAYEPGHEPRPLFNRVWSVTAGLAHCASACSFCVAVPSPTRRRARRHAEPNVRPTCPRGAAKYMFANEARVRGECTHMYQINSCSQVAAQHAKVINSRFASRTHPEEASCEYQPAARPAPYFRFFQVVLSTGREAKRPSKRAKGVPMHARSGGATLTACGRTPRTRPRPQDLAKIS